MTNFIESNDYSSDESLFTVTQYVNRVEKPGQPIASWSLSDQKDISGKSLSMKCFIDTGSKWNIIPFDILQSIVKNPILKKTESQLKFYDEAMMKSIGKYSLYTKLKNKCFKLCFEIVLTKASWNPLLWANTSEKLSIYSINNDVNAIGNSIVKKYAGVFEELGCLPGKLHLEIYKNVTPVQHSLRRIPVALKDDKNSKLNQMIKQGILKVNESANWISSFEAAKKPEKLRICIDPKNLNKALKRNHYYIRTLDDILSNLAKAKAFSVLDAKDSYHQIQLDDKSSYLTTFWWPKIHLCWLWMPFRIKPASGEYQRQQEEMLEGLKGVETISSFWGMVKSEKNLLKITAKT